MRPLQVLAVAPEIFPLIKTGGLGDVAGALPKALKTEGVSVLSLVPGYPAVVSKLGDGEVVSSLDDLFGAQARLVAAEISGLKLLVLDAPELYQRPGGPYTDTDGRDWPDNAIRFAALAFVAAQIGRGLVSSFLPDIIHAHDWQAGLTPAYLHYAGERAPATVLTVHNLAFQGVFSADLLEPLRLPWSSYSPDGLEYHGAISFLKAGLVFAERITTVSPSYALEIQTDEGGMGLGGLLRARSPVLSGILNGIDTTVWNPTNDPYLVKSYDARHLPARTANKLALQEQLGLARGTEALLFGVISRLSQQKGLDLLLESLPVLLDKGAQLAVLGTGDKGVADEFARASKEYPGRVAAVLGFDERLAHLIQAGADAVFVPSRFEPCGITQLCALRYGAVPIVARVGGLADTVIDANEMALSAGVATGIQFSPVTREMLKTAILRAQRLWQDRHVWNQLQRNGMKTDVGWTRSARLYAELYARILS